MLGFPTILVLLRDRHHLCRVPTDDLPRSAVAIVFRHRVMLRPAEREADPPNAERIAAASSSRYRPSTGELRITYGRGGGAGRPRGDGRVRGVTLGLAVAVGVAEGVPVGLGVAVGVELGVGVGGGVTEGVTVGVTVEVGVAVGVAVGVPFGVGVAVGIGVGVTVGLGVGVGVGVSSRQLESIDFVIGSNVDAPTGNNAGSAVRVRPRHQFIRATTGINNSTSIAIVTV